MKKIVIIGATGEVGMYVVDFFYKNVKEYEIVPVGRRKTSFFDRYSLNYISIDIIKEEDLEKLPQNDVYAIIFTAAMMPGRMVGYDPMKYVDTNIRGTLNVMMYAQRIGVDRVIYTQTIRDVGNLIGNSVIESDSPRNYSLKGDHAMYVISKNAAVDIIEHYYQEYGIKRYIFRLPTVYMYSPNQYYCVNGEKRIMAFRHLINQAIDGKEIEVWGDADRAHDVLYVKDLANLFYLACTCDGVDGGIYNAGTGVKVSIYDQIAGMIEVFDNNKTSKIIMRPDKPNARDYTIDISKAQRELGYAPQYSYIDYLKDFKLEMEQDRFRDLFNE